MENKRLIKMLKNTLTKDEQKRQHLLLMCSIDATSNINQYYDGRASIINALINLLESEEK